MDEQNVLKWVKKLQRLLKQMPDGIEVICTDGSLDIYPKGTLSNHLTHPEYGQWGISGVDPIETIESPIKPYGESE